MYNRLEQIETIQSIKVSEGESKTIDCPFCYGKKKFSITNKEGTVLWNCYKASCNAQGAYKKGMSLNAIRTRANNPTIVDRKKTKDIPPIVSHPKHHPSVMKYLEENVARFNHFFWLNNIRWMNLSKGLYNKSMMLNSTLEGIVNG